MSILSDFEDRLAGAVEGVFAGAFRSPVQPVEIAKALGSSMDDGRQGGVNTVYAPTSYTVRISSADAEEGVGNGTAPMPRSTSSFVARAQEQQYHLASKPTVGFVVDEKLKLGRFRVSAEMASGAKPAPRTPESTPKPPAPPAADAPDESSLTGEIAALSGEETIAAPVAETSTHDFATVTVSDIHHDVALKSDRVVVGRLAGCGICLQDANVSREHAAFVRDETGWSIEDLGSTNGTQLNGEAVKRERLADGDTVQVGVTELEFHEPRM